MTIHDAAALHEAVAVVHGMRKDAAECRPFVVITDKQHLCDRACREMLLKLFIGRDFTPMGEIAGDDEQVGVGMFHRDALQCRIETLARIEAKSVAGCGTKCVSVR